MVVLTREQKPLTNNKGMEGHSNADSEERDFGLAKTVAKMGYTAGVLLPSPHRTDHLEGNNFSYLNGQELYFEFEKNSNEVGMISPKNALEKAQLAIFEPTIFATLLERALLYAYLKKVETIVMLGEDVQINDSELLGFADYIITHREIGNLESHRATIVFNSDDNSLSARYDGVSLLRLHLPASFKEDHNRAMQPFTAGFSYALLKGSHISAAIKVGVAMADIALQSKDFIPSDCDTSHLRRHYDTIMARL